MPPKLQFRRHFAYYYKIMKNYTPLILALCVLIGVAATAQDKVTFEIAPAVGLMFGQTEYEMDLRYVNEGTPYRTRSLLEFPLGSTYLGLQATMHGGTYDVPNDWRIEALILTNMNDPSGKMYDHDWDSENNEPLTKFSYTESNSKLKSLVLETSGSKKMHGGAIDIYFRLGFNYYHYDYEVIDFEGWQLLGDVPHYIEGTETGILYVIDYYFPYAAVQFEGGRPGGDWQTALGAGLGAIFFSDEDDHLLRFKKATANGTGFGLKADINIRRYLGNRYNANRPYIEAFADLHYFDASGDQTQRWYGDDPASDDYDDTGDFISGLPHDVRSLAYRIGLKLGFTF